MAPVPENSRTKPETFSRQTGAVGGRENVEVWIVNLVDQTVEVYREPYFTGYGSKTILRAGDKAQPQGFPDVAVDVAELLIR